MYTPEEADEDVGNESVDRNSGCRERIHEWLRVLSSPLGHRYLRASLTTLEGWGGNSRWGEGFKLGHSFLMHYSITSTHMSAVCFCCFRAQLQ